MLLGHVTHWASLSPLTPISSTLLCWMMMAALAGRWERRLGVGVSARLVSRICSAPPPPVSVSREQAACLARLGFLPIFPLCQTEEEGSREGESSGKLPRGKAGQQRKQEKYIFLSLLSPSKALYSFLFLCASHSPGFSSSLPPSLPFSLCPALTQTPNPPPFTPHSFLNLKALLLYQPFINCSPCTSLLLTSSLFFLSITSEHATSQHNPFTHSRWLQHTLFFFSIFFPAFFCFVFVAPFVVFAIIYASSFAPHHHLFVVPGLVFECVAAPSTRLPDSDVSITVNVRIN